MLCENICSPHKDLIYIKPFTIRVYHIILDYNNI